MNGKTGGQRPRPRVALLGDFGANDVEHFQRMFPTIWSAKNTADLKELVDVREIDLIIIASGVAVAGAWPKTTHIICFSKYFLSFPGPVSNSFLQIEGAVETEEFLFPDVPLPLSRRREADYRNLTSVRGWPRLSLQFESYRGQYLTAPAKRKVATTIFNSGAIICERHNNSPLAVTFLREDTNLFVSWLPSVDKNYAGWVEVLVTQWAQSDKDAFPNFGDWMSSPEWLVVEEELILSQIQVLERKKQKSVIEINKHIDELTNALAIAKTNANKGQRRLITAQGKDLFNEVAKALEDIGFNVVDVDELIGEKGPRREDLRLGYSAKGGGEWNAIVEIRGYTRSGGKTADLSRLYRFANLYKNETGQNPDKLIYIVNGELELPPSQRREPLAPATEDLQLFAELDGILIWSLDLFRALKATDLTDYPAILESIKSAQGRWVPVVT